MDCFKDQILTGNFVGSKWDTSPFITPYAQAIADHYPIQVPWFHSQEISIARPNFQIAPLQVYLLRPQLYDILIYGCSVLDHNFPGLIDNLYLQVTNEEDGVPWVAPTTELGYSPVGAFGAVVTREPAPVFRTNVSKFPEAFFLPKFTMLRFEWTLTQQQVQTNATFTLLGIQLINHAKNFQAPRHVRMPDGSHIRLGSRVPFYATVPFGDRTFGDYFGMFQLPENQQILQFTPPAGCDIEMHDAYANFLSSSSPDGSLPQQRYAVKIADRPNPTDWTPGLTPVDAVAGYQIRQHPQLPFPAPCVLRKGHRYGLTLQNNNLDNQLFGGTLTFRGVRRCEY